MRLRLQNALRGETIKLSVRVIFFNKLVKKEVRGSLLQRIRSNFIKKGEEVSSAVKISFGINGFPITKYVKLR